MTYEPLNLKRWTMPDHYFGAQWPEYYRAGIGRHRDSDCLAQSNFKTALQRLGGESETVKVVCENHFAVGWVEWIAIHETDETALAIADDMQAALESYPILDESDFSEREHEEATEIWRDCYSVKCRIDYVRRHKDEFEFTDFADLLGCIRGKYFAGYASTLLN